MASVSLSISDVETREIRQLLSPRQYEQAMYQARKRTTRKARVMTGDVVRGRYTIRKKFIDSPSSRDAAITSVIPSNPSAPGKVIISRKPLPLTEFDHIATPTAGVSIRVDTKRPALLLRHAFLARVKGKGNSPFLSLHVGIFTRKKVSGGGSNRSKSVARTFEANQFNEQGFAWRLPIQERFGPPVYDLIIQNDVEKPLLSNIHEEFRRQVGNQISRFTGGRIKTIGALTIDSEDTDT